MFSEDGETSTRDDGASPHRQRRFDPSGQRYINHAERGSHVILLVRPANKDAWGRTQPFTFLGPATYKSHTGERPMAIVWTLHQAMPMDVFKVARVTGG